GKIPAADGSGGHHHEGFGQPDTGIALGVQQFPQRRLLRVIRTRRITCSRTDAAVFLADELLVAEFLVRSVTPELLSYPLVQVLGTGLGEAVGECLQHDRRVIVVVLLERGDVLLDTETRGDGEASDIVADTGVTRRDEIRKTAIGQSVAVVALLAQMMKHRELPGAAFILVE